MATLIETRTADGALALRAVSATIPTTAEGDTADTVTVDVGCHIGTLVRMDIAMSAAVNAIITLRVFTKSGEDADDSAYMLAEMTGVTKSFHPLLNTLFANCDSPQTNNLYVSMENTGVDESTGSVTVIFWVTN